MSALERVADELAATLLPTPKDTTADVKRRRYWRERDAASASTAAAAATEYTRTLCTGYCAATRAWYTAACSACALVAALLPVKSAADRPEKVAVTFRIALCLDVVVGRRVGSITSVGLKLG